MTAKNRAALIGKLHTALKKHFKPAPPSPGRPLMEHVLYASLLEDSPADLADEGFAKCEQEYFDWNEVRVTTVTELAEVLNRLPNPQAAALRLKRNLQSIFETFYNFDIDFLKKENLGKAVAKFESMTGMSHFVLAYIVQHGLGGHSIPIDKSSMKLMWLCGIVSDAEADSGKVPGIERTIPKNKSIEFSSLLHQAAIAFQANNKEKSVWDVLLAVNKDAKALFDRPVPEKPKTEKRSAAKAKAAEVAHAAAEAAAAKVSAAKAIAKADSKNKTTSGKAAAAEAAAKSTAKAAPAKPESEKPSSGKPGAAKTASEKAPADKPADKSVQSKPTTEKASSAKAAAPVKAAPAKPVSEKKPISEKKPGSKPAAPPAKPTSTKGAAPSTKSVKGNEASSKPTSSKPASKKTEVAPKSAKKPDAAAPAKKASAKKPVVKQEVPEKKSEKKPEPPTKKSPPSDKAAVGSTNKKLTKQKPR